MSNSRHKEAILSPSLSRITKRIRSSITEHFLHGMFYILPPARQNVLPMSPERSVTYVSGRSREFRGPLYTEMYYRGSTFHYVAERHRPCQVRHGGLLR